MPYKDPETRKLKQREYARKHYEENKEQVMDKAKSAAKLNYPLIRALIAADKLEKGCSVCGYKKCLRALQYHHPDPKKKDFNVADAAQRRMSLKRVQKEIDKCVVLCANCHFEEHERLYLDVA